MFCDGNFPFFSRVTWIDSHLGREFVEGPADGGRDPDGGGVSDDGVAVAEQAAEAGCVLTVSVEEPAELAAVGGGGWGCEEVLDTGGKAGLCLGEVGKDVVDVFRRGPWSDGGGVWRVFADREVVWFVERSVLVVGSTMMGETARRVGSSDGPAGAGGPFFGGGGAFC